MTTEAHGQGEGVFMKFMNCGCLVAIAITVFLVAFIVANAVRQR